MEYKIEKGDKFVCLGDYIMDDNSIAYLSGVEYVSDRDKCITDRYGDEEHEMEGQNDFFEFFRLKFCSV